MKLNPREILTPALILCAICLVVAAALAGTNLLTKDRIAEQNRLKAEASRQQVLQQADSFEPVADDGGFSQNNIVDCFAGKKGGEIVGYVFTATAKSYGGDITVITGVASDGKVSGVALLSINDTPGLGMNAQKESFRSQYKQAAPQGGFAVVKNQAAGEGEIAAMTGATITSSAVTNAVNSAVAQFQKLKGGE